MSIPKFFIIALLISIGSNISQLMNGELFALIPLAFCIVASIYWFSKYDEEVRR